MSGGPAERAGAATIERVGDPVTATGAPRPRTPSGGLVTAILRAVGFAIVRLADASRAILMRSERAHQVIFLPGLEAARWRFG